MSSIKILKSEDGSALIIAVLILLILTVLGMSSNTSSTIDLQIAANDREYVQDFYVADSGWKAAVNWLEIKAAPPEKVNADTDEVRNFGGGSSRVDGDGDLTFDEPEDLTDGTEDATIDGTPYWYNVTYESDEIEPGSGKSYRKFTYSARSVADKAHEIEVQLSKVYKVGY